MVPDGKGNFIASYNAAMLSFGGKNSILDHSVVIHAPNLTRLACDNIVGYVVSGPDSSTQSSGDGYSSKDVAEGNRRSSSSSGASVRAASLSAALLLVAGAVFA
ncbi:hypothetical protein H4R21_002015 [Coemansia helicoidea]|nr:hypothetical protein H4R21_002015 [Coemansia helicoidea]